MSSSLARVWPKSEAGQARKIVTIVINGRGMAVLTRIGRSFRATSTRVTFYLQPIPQIKRLLTSDGEAGSPSRARPAIVYNGGFGRSPVLPLKMRASHRSGSQVASFIKNVVCQGKL